VHRFQGNRRLVLLLALCGLAACAAGCSSSAATGSASDATPAAAGIASTGAPASTAGGSDPGCRRALSDVSRYGPSTVKLLADGRKSVAKGAVQLLVDGLDGAADAAGTAKAKQAIQVLATAYEDYFDLTTDAVSIPLSTLLKDTVDFESVCG
jgi:hypothetical protein